MENKIESIIRQVIFIPDDFRWVNKSWMTLLAEYGYFKNHEKITIKLISESLQKYPECISLWLRWSEDQRCTPSWFFTISKRGVCFVGHEPSSKEFEEITTTDQFTACAIFIQNLLKDSLKYAKIF